MGLIGRETIIFPPLPQPDHDRKKVAAFAREDVLLIGAAIGGRSGFQNAKRREVLQPRRQDALGNPKPFLKLIEALYAIERVANDEQRSPVADCVEGSRDRAICVIEACSPDHIFLRVPLLCAHRRA